MSILRLLASASSTIVLLSACTSSAPSEKVGTGGTGGGGSSGSVSTGVGGTGGVSSAWKAAPDQRFGKIALASAGHEGALAYVESTAADSAGLGASVIKLQRLDATGARRGAAVELGHVASSSSPRLTLASSGDRYLACWDDASAGQISCALAPVADGPSLPALSVAGLWPSLAYSAGAWTLAYGVLGHAVVARVTDDGSGLGAPALFDVEKASLPRVQIAATSDGFALVSATDFDAGDNIHLHRLDSAFAPLGAPLDLGMRLWIRDAAAMAVNGSKIAVDIGEPYGSHLFIIEAGAVIGTHSFSGGGKEGTVGVTLTGDGATFGRLALDDGGGPLTYTRIEGDPLIAKPQEPESDHPLVLSYSAFAMLPIDGNRLFASTVGSQNDEIIVAAVHEP